MNVITTNDEIKNYDFVFVCESKVRELESCCLIGQELENRGYTVGILNWWLPNIDITYKPVKTKVLLAHAVYKDASLNKELSYIDGPTKVINLQWEQIYSIKDLTNPNAPWKMEGDAKKVIHLSWGKDNFNKLTTYDGVSSDRIKIVGQVSMDFLNPKLRGYYLPREELLSTYGIPNNKKICLFISSFSFVNLPENVQESELHELRILSVESQKKVLEWIESALDYTDDIVFIYRPHPSEASNQKIQNLVNKYSNFYCISDLSVKQWILISDVIYNWYSTSIADVFFAGKSCHILRPIEINHELECKIFENGHFITTKESFFDTLSIISTNFPIPLENIQQAYSYDSKDMSYVRIADECEQILFEDDTIFESNRKRSYLKLLIFEFKSTSLGKLLLKVKHFIEFRKEKSETQKRNSDYEHYIKEMYEKNYFQQKEVDTIVYKIKKALYT